MEFALMTEPQLGGTYQQLLDAARYAESAGLVAFARSDHYLWSGDAPPDATDAFASLAGLARDTDTIRLCVLVSPITFRHPAVIAKSATTIDQIAGGRFDLGIGTGWMEREHEAFGFPFPPWRERFDRLEEAVGYVRAAFAGDATGFAGRYYHLEAIDSRPKPTGPLPIIIGGSGPRRTPTLAGTHADEYNHFAAPAERIAPKLDVLRAAARDAGRDPGAIVVSVMGPVVTGRDEAGYRRRLAAAAERRGRTPEEQETVLSNAGVPHGTAEQVRRTLTALEDAGVTKYYVQHLDLTDLSDLDETFEVLLG